MREERKHAIAEKGKVDLIAEKRRINGGNIQQFSDETITKVTETMSIRQNASRIGQD